MPRKRHKIDHYDALGCMGCLIIIIAAFILVGFIALCILLIHDIKVVYSL